MTLANKITITRILLIPVFVLLAVYYGHSVEHHAPDERLRYAAIGIFILAAASDGLDGYVARKYKQKSRLGSILDPLADKGLMLAAVLVLSFAKWENPLPLWFPVLVISRDLFTVVGSLVLHLIVGSMEVKPSWLGKASTACQMVAIAWVMLQLDWLPQIIPVGIAGVFTFLSGVGYLITGLRLLHSSENSHAS